MFPPPDPVWFRLSSLNGMQYTLCGNKYTGQLRLVFPNWSTEIIEMSALMSNNTVNVFLLISAVTCRCKNWARLVRILQIVVHLIISFFDGHNLRIFPSLRKWSGFSWSFCSIFISASVSTLWISFLTEAVAWPERFDPTGVLLELVPWDSLLDRLPPFLSVEPFLPFPEAFPP